MSEAAQMRGARLMVVDDRADNRYILVELLTSTLADCVVVQADSATEALALAQDDDLDGAIVDVQMPGTSGIDLCRQLKADPATHALPVLLITSHRASPELRAAGLEAGADDFINRPLDNRELLARVRVMLRLRRAERGLREANERLAEQLERKLQLSEALAELWRRTATTNAEETAYEVLRTARRLTGSPLGYVAEFRGDQTFKHTLSGLPDVEETQTTEIAEGLHREPYAAASPLLIDGPVATSSHAPEGHPQVDRLLAVPVCYGEERLGQIAVANATRPYGDGDVTAVEELARLYALLLHRDRQQEEQERLEDQLRQAQRLESVGRLAGGVAHDYNNLLTVILSYAGFLSEGLSPADPMHADAEMIVETARRAESLTRQLLAFSRRQVLQPRVVDLNTVVLDLRKMLWRLIGEDIHLQTDLGADLSPIHADPGQLEQVIVNLVVNARDAMPAGGDLRIETENVVLTAEHVATLHLTPGPHVALHVIDSGVGMSPETRARAFEPFFTTKDIGKGTGLGLSTVYGIVRQSDGDITLRSEPERGTTFTIYLPRTAQLADDPTNTAPESMPPRGSEKVLVVEDETPVRNLVRRMLEQQGYDVLEAQNGTKALALAAQHTDIDLLLTDVVMPGPTGQHTAETLRELQPQLKVIFMSGYSNEAVAQRGVLTPGCQFVQKPFTRLGLLNLVRQVLDEDNA